MHHPQKMMLTLYREGLFPVLALRTGGLSLVAWILIHRSGGLCSVLSFSSDIGSINEEMRHL